MCWLSTIARLAWQTAIMAINNHQEKISESVLQIFNTTLKTTDVVANTVVKQVFDTTYCQGLGIVFF